MIKKKTLNKLSIEGMYLNTIKVICEKSTVNIILNSEKLYGPANPLMDIYPKELKSVS